VLEWKLCPIIITSITSTSNKYKSNNMSL